MERIRNEMWEKVKDDVKRVAKKGIGESRGIVCQRINKYCGGQKTKEV